MKNFMRKWGMVVASGTLGLAVALLISRCGTNSSTSTSYRQIEQLARPGINEALLITPAYLNGFNAYAPTFTGVSTATVNAVVGEAQAVLGAFYYSACLINGVVSNDGATAALTAATGLKPGGVQCPFIGTAIFSDGTATLKDTMKTTATTYASAVTGYFLPDTMRIDTSAASGYLTLCNALASGSPALCGGRKLDDDVIDITLNFLLSGAAITQASAAQFRALVSDGVQYKNSAVIGDNPTSLQTVGAGGNPNQGHTAVLAAFPYAPAPY